MFAFASVSIAESYQSEVPYSVSGDVNGGFGSVNFSAVDTTAYSEYSSHQKQVSMATSMAAAIAASLPAPTAEAAPAPARTEIPQWMEKVIDVEAELPIDRVQLDGMVRAGPHLRSTSLS